MTDCTNEIQKKVVDAFEQKSPLQIVGGDTKQDILGRTTTSNSKLNIAAHNGIIDYNPAELVLTARSGTTISEIQSTLAKEGQTLSFEPPDFSGKATLGGTIACNMSGPGRPWAGSARDLVLGVQLINGKGDLLNFGGQVMKNVAGYDVSRLQSGALGTLGVLTRITLKVLPIAEHSLTLCYEVTDRDALEIMTNRFNQAKPLTGAFWVDGNLYLRLSGAESAVQHTAKQWGGEQLPQSTSIWRDLREFTLPFFGGEEAFWRLSHSPVAVLQHDMGATLIDWAGAQRWLKGQQTIETLRHIAKNAGGHASLYKGGDRSTDVNHPMGQLEQSLQKRLKHAFDPAGILNPGRLYSWL